MRYKGIEVRFIHNNPPVPGEKTVFDAITESPELLAVFLSNTCQTLTEAYNRKFGKEILYDYKESKDKFLEHLNQKAGE